MGGIQRLGMLLLRWYTIDHRVAILSVCIILWSLAWASVPRGTYGMGLFAIMSLPLTFYCHPYRVVRSGHSVMLWVCIGVFGMVSLLVSGYVISALELLMVMNTILMLALADAQGLINWCIAHLCHVLYQGRYGWLFAAAVALAMALLVPTTGMLWLWARGALALCAIPLVAWWYEVSWHKAPFVTVISKDRAL